MATLQKIRNRAGVLIAVIIGIALFSFVLSDMINKGSSLSDSGRDDIAEISGKTLKYQMYQAKVDEISEIQKQNSGKNNLDEQTMEMIRDQTWELLIKQMVMEDELEELGIAVTSDELFDMVQGKNIHPQVKQLFTNPQTGAFDSLQVIRFLKNMDQDQTGKQKAYWLFVEDALMRDRLTTKYNNAIKKGLYVTTEQAKREAAEKNHKVNFKFVGQAYSQIPDSTLKVEDKDLKDYYNKNKKKYDQEASRDLEYVTFEVLPSQEDLDFVKSQFEKLTADLKNATDAKELVNANSDVPYNDAFFTKGKLPQPADSIMFKANIGDVYGPWVENNTYKLVKLIDIKNMPDSVKASHILFAVNDKIDAKKAKASADSLLAIIKKDKKADFVELAKKFSKDPGSAEKGGDLGWFKQGMMVKPFNDACFLGKKGDITVVETQFGAHIIKVVDKGKDAKNIQVATIEKAVKPSSKTIQQFYTKASEFAGMNNSGEKFDKAVADKGLTKKIANNLRENDRRIAGLENPREMVRWAYGAKKGEISKVFEFGTQFVVAKLTSIKEKGIAPFDQKKEDLIPLVKKEKKGEMLAKKLNDAFKTAKTLDAIASYLKTTVGMAEDISFSSFSIPGAGIEPVVIAIASQMKPGSFTKALKGNNGVYIVQIEKETEKVDSDYKTEQKNLTNTLQGQVDYKAYEALKKLADIKDMRSKFF